MTTPCCSRQSSLGRIAERIPEPPAGSGPSREAIAEVVALIAERFRPEQIVLFGSHAYGVPTEESDVDLMVVTDGGRRPAAILAAIHAAFPFACVSYDVKVRTTSEIRLGLAERDFFLLDVVERGVAFLGGDGGRALASDLVAAARHDRERGSSGLKQVTRGWLIKADWYDRAARRLIEPSKPLPDHACFYARESVETYLKALLQEREIRSGRSDDLAELAALAGLTDRATAVAPRLWPELRWLSQFTSDITYPGWTGETAEPTRALRIAGDVGALVRPALGLDSDEEG